MKTLDEFLEDIANEQDSRGSGGDSEEDYGEEESPGEEPSYGSEDDEDYGSDEYSDEDYGSEGSSNYSDDSDREYTGDMFVKKQPIKY